MFKVEVLETFTFSKYDEIKDSLVSKSTKRDGWLYKEDVFECNKEILEYLLGANPIKRAVVKVIEIKEEQPKVEVKEEVKEVKKATKKKKTSKK